MAITREQVLAAVERYLPRTVNYVQDATLGTTDNNAVFSRIQQIVLTSLLVDQDTVFYLVYLAAQRLLADVESAIRTLEILQGPDGLQAITPDDPERISDLTQLQSARVNLVRLSSSVAVDGVFGDEALEDFKTDIEGFMSDQVFPNVDEGNRSAAVRTVRAAMASLLTQWDSVIERRENTFSLLEKYQDSDLRTRVSSTVLSSIQAALRTLESRIPTLSTEAQGRISEDLLVELAAAEAAIVIIGSAPNPEGTVIAGPAGDGRTGFTSSVASGIGRAEPILPVITGTDGELLLFGPGGGPVFVSENGFVNYPGPTTTTFADLSVNFIAAGIQEGMSLVFVDTGRLHTVESVDSINQLTISPATQVSTDLRRYAITEHFPGQYFQSLANDFWTEHASGDSEDLTIISNPTSGGFLQRVTVVVTDATNIRADGTAGVLFKVDLTGTTTDHDGTFIEDTSATFLSDGVSVGDQVEVVGTTADGTYSVVAVLSQIELELDNGTNFGPGSLAAYTIWKPGADNQLYDQDATFLSDGVSTADSLRVLAPASQAGDYPITSVVSQTVVETGTTFTNDVVDWEIVPTANDIVLSDAVNFLQSGVLLGDIINVAVNPGEREIIEVGQNFVRVVPALTLPSISGVATIYAPPGTFSNIFRQTTDNFITAGVDSSVTVEEIQGGETVEVIKTPVLTVDGVDYQILKLAELGEFLGASPGSDLLIFPLVQGAGEFTDTVTLLDENAQFQTAGVASTKHQVTILSGANAGESFTIVSVDSENQLTLAPAGVVGEVTNYQILPRTGFTRPWSVVSGLRSRHFFDTSGDAPFTGTEGRLFVWKPGTSEEIRTTIDTVISSTEVWLSDSVPMGETASYAVGGVVKPGMDLLAKQRRFDIVQIYNQNTLEVSPAFSTSAGKNMVFQVVQDGSGIYSSRISDYDGAFAFDDSPTGGYSDALKDFRVDLTIGTQPATARFLQALDLDGDGFFEAFQVNTQIALGTTEIDYRILEDFTGRTTVFFAEEVAPLPVAGQTLTIWGYGRFGIADAVSATPDMQIFLDSSTQAGLTSESYVIVEGGSIYHGEYLLFSGENDAVSLDPDTSLLRLKVAEVLIDYGGELIIPIASGAAGEVVEDGDQDGFSGIFTDPAADFSSAEYGDRLTVTYDDTTVAKVFLTSVTNTTTIVVTPELEQKLVASWELERNSVSSALNEAERLRQQLISLRDIIRIFNVEVNQTVSSAIDLLQSVRMDRAIDFLLDGKVDEYISLRAEQSSYSSFARSAVQSVGNLSSPSAALDANVAGIDPATGKSSPSATNATNYLSDSALGEDVDVLVALSGGIRDMVADEVTRSLSSISFEELRNRAIYELTGNVVSGVILDQDSTLPWIAKTGSLRDRVAIRYGEVRDAVQYMIDHPDEFEEIK